MIVSASASASPAAPLIVVRDLREVVGAGHGNATASVRTLDGVSLEVHAGELLLVGGPVAGGAHALCTALAAPRRGLIGERRVCAGVQIRRATISPAARDVIVRTWADDVAPLVAHAPVASTQATPGTPDAARVVYILRVRSCGAGGAAAAPTSAWRDWTSALRASHGAVVLFSAAPAVRPRRVPALHVVHEPEVHDPDAHVTRGRVRALHVLAGRVVSERVLSAEARVPASRYADSDASRSPIASSRCSTGSTAPSSRDDAGPR